MFLRALAAFIILPGIAAGLLPYLIVLFDRWRWEGSLYGLIAVVLGLTILLRCVYDFYRSGNGTLAHWDPPKKIVTIGLYRFSRNPMYIGVILILIGEVLLYGSSLLCIYIPLLLTAFVLHIRLVEEPWLARTFPKEWQEYSQATPRWFGHASK